jgi:hypothetical protein
MWECIFPDKTSTRYDMVIGFHTHPFRDPVPSYSDIMSLYVHDDEQISCIGGNKNKIYCFEKPNDLRLLDHESVRNLRDKLLQNDELQIAFRKFYPFDQYNEETGEYINELRSFQMIHITNKDDKRSFEWLSNWREQVATEAKIDVLENEKIVHVRRFVCNNDGLFEPEPEPPKETTQQKNYYINKIKKHNLV